MIRVGLTGGIASGKSTVARMMRQRGCPVLDLDQVSRQITAPGSPLLRQIADHFGQRFLDAEGRLDRPRLGRLVASDPRARQQLEALTHPLILEEMEAWLATQAASAQPVAVVEASLLVEKQLYPRFHRLVVVVCGRERQLQRLMERDQISRPDAERWLAAQLPETDKRALAHHLVPNHGSLRELEASVEALWQELRAAAP